MVGALDTFHKGGPCLICSNTTGGFNGKADLYLFHMFLTSSHTMSNAARSGVCL